MNKTGLMNLFYKERYLLKSDSQYKKPASRRDLGFCINRIEKESIPESVINFLQKRLKTNVLQQRLACKEIDLFAAFERNSGQPVGYYWSLISHQKEYWHDSFKIPVNTALVFNAYVADHARRKGVYTSLINETHHYLLVEKNCEAVFTIVESRNLASLNANLTAHLVKFKRNYLIKFFGKNIFSIYENGDTDFYFTLFRKKNMIL